MQSPQHEQHHRDKFTNFGPDYMDVLYNTKGDETPESLNSGVVNIAVLTCMFCLVRRVRGASS